MKTKDIEARIRKLPEDLIPEVIAYIDSLMSGYANKDKERKQFKFDWEGGLSDLKVSYSSINLQHKVADWR